MGVHLVYLVNHFLRARELVADKLHGVPCIVGSPVLPVLDNAVQRHSHGPVSLYHIKQFLLAPVTLAALMVAVGPERHHGNLSREFAD